MTTATMQRSPLWTRGDLDGFFGLMVDNLAQVLLIVALAGSTAFAGLPPEIIFGRILPGVALSLLLGNLFYAWQARRSARRWGNPACTALPYGINTPSVIAYIYFVMRPVYQETQDPELTWAVGLLACLVSGLIEFAGAFCAERLRRVTPRAALLGVLAAVGITFIAADFAFRIYAYPLIGVTPLAILLLAYFGRFHFPGRLPGGLIAVVFGTGVAWLLVALEHSAVPGTGNGGWLAAPAALRPEAIVTALHEVRWTPPVFSGQAVWTLLLERPDLLLRFLAVSVPMGLLNLLGSLQNIESAEAAGDRFATAPALAMNGIGSIAAGLFGSCFPTTIYIGHPGWKALGARSSYSVLNGLFFTMAFLFGLGGLLVSVVPVEAGAAIVMYIGIIITAQAFQTTPREHAPAVALAFFPAMAALLLITLDNFTFALGATTTFAELLRADPAPYQAGLLRGLLAIRGANEAWIIVTLILAALATELIRQRFRAAAAWCFVAAGLTGLGLLHAYRLVGNELHALFVWDQVEAGAATVVLERGYAFALSYALAGALFLWIGLYARRASAVETS